MDLSHTTILVTGGTGSFGRRFVEKIVPEHRPAKLIVFSRDEYKQSEMQKRFPMTPDSPIRYFLGDIRDRDRLYRAFQGVDVVVHAAALKQVPALEYNPIEAVKTNILGAANLVDAAIDCGVTKVIALSTDKAVNPINLYGATKLCADKLFIQANNYSRWKRTKFAIARYGNVMGSRGSVLPLFLEARKAGVLPITDLRMTRFWMTLDQSVDFVISSLASTEGGEIFVPKIPSVRIAELARVLAPDAELRTVGIRPGEKLHEVLVSSDDAHNSVELPDRFVVLARAEDWDGRMERVLGTTGGARCPDGFTYRSDNNPQWVTEAQIWDLVRRLEARA